MCQKNSVLGSFFDILAEWLSASLTSIWTTSYFARAYVEVPRPAPLQFNTYSLPSIARRIRNYCLFEPALLVYITAILL